MPFSVWARGDSSSANNAEINSTNTNTQPTTLLTFEAVAGGDEVLEFNGGLPDPDTIVYVNGDTTTPLQFTLEFGGFLDATNKLRNVNGEDLRGAEVLVLTLETGERLFFLRNYTFQPGDPEETEYFNLMEAFPNGAQPLAPGTQYVCFTAGTLIETPDGPVAVEALKPGDLVSGHAGGQGKVVFTAERTITSDEIRAFPKHRPVTIPAGHFAPGVPERDLTVSPLHRILVTGFGIERLFGHDAAFVAARDLPDVHIAPVDDVTYVHILTEAHMAVLANGCPAETLLPGDMALLALGPDARAEIETLVTDRKAAYPCLTAREAAVWRAETQSREKRTA